MEILAITQDHSCWNDTIRFAEHCSWRGGRHLAEIMRTKQFCDWERVLIALQDHTIVGFCTLTEKDELSDAYDFSPFIGCIFVDERHRGRRISEKLIQKALGLANKAGFKAVYIMSGEIGLYEKYGFSSLGYYKTIFDTTEQLFMKCTRHSDFQE